MFNTLLGVRLASSQYSQIRFGSRVRGKAPIFCRTIQQRLDELNKKDELYTARVNIGLPPAKKPSNIRQLKLDHIKKLKSDKNLEQLARKHELRINLDDARQDWLNTTGPGHKKQVAEHYGVFEHLYGEGYFYPYVNIDIHYELSEGDLPVCTGNVIKPAEAKSKPKVTWVSDGNTLWTLALTSLDGHLTEPNKEYIHWLVSNIPGNHVEKGDVLAEYLQPFPPKGTGSHRYVFVLYKQNGPVKYDVPTVTTASPLEQRTFITRDWYKKYQDEITPAGLAFYQSDYDSSVKEFFHNVLNMKEPEYEYDFPAPYIRPQEWFPRRRPFNLYMDKYRDPKQINKEYLLRKLKTEDPLNMPPPPLKFPNAHPLPKDMPSWLKLHEKKIRLKWGRVNDV